MPLAIALATAVTLAVFVAFPLLAPGTEGDQLLPVDVTPLADLKRRRMVVYENLQDLEFEFKAGKIAREDYQTMSENYKAEAAGLMAASLEAETTTQGDAWIEREVAARRARRKVAPSPQYLCPECGFENPLPVKFCGECGAKLASRPELRKKK